MKNKISLMIIALFSVVSLGYAAGQFGHFTWAGAHYKFITTASGEKLSVDKIKKQALSYPNPFSLSSPDQSYPQLFYYLEEDANIDIHIYSPMGRALLKTHKMKGFEGGQKDINVVSITQDLLDFRYLSPGVYFFVIINKDSNKTIYKGEIAVWP
jgi:hypothetical protein